MAATHRHETKQPNGFTCKMLWNTKKRIVLFFPLARICNPCHNRMFVERRKNGTDYKSAPASLIFYAMDSCLRRNDARESL